MLFRSVLLLRQPEAEGGIGNQFLVQWLEEAGAFQFQRLGDLLFVINAIDGSIIDVMKGY